MYLNREGDCHDEISNVWLLDLHLLPSRSLVCGGYCACLIESKTMLSGCLEEKSNFKKHLKAY